MNAQRLEQILAGFQRVRVLVVGDFFLDKYLVMDPTLSEISLETGLEAYQVVRKRISPGAAGTVTANLAALGAARIDALGMIGRDGEGFELRSGLEAMGVCTDLLVETTERFTPTYTKPMLLEGGVEREINRIDIKNRQPLPPDVESLIVERLRRMAPQVNAVVVSDQVQERNCGVITDAVREELAVLARQYPSVVFIADSRTRIGEFRNVWIKPNRYEAHRALRADEPGPLCLKEVMALGRALQERTQCPVYITLGEAGIACVAGEETWHVPTLHPTGPIDIVGAGDSVMAGITLALCSGARPEEAAVVGNVVASLTIQQIGVTGTTTREAVWERFRHAEEAFCPRLLSE